MAILPCKTLFIFGYSALFSYFNFFEYLGSSEDKGVNDAGNSECTPNNCTDLKANIKYNVKTAM